MPNLTLGDLAQTFQLRRANVRLQDEALRLTNELSTGHRADISTALSGDFGPIVGVERQLEALRAYKTATIEAGLQAEATQLALDKVQSITGNFAPQLVAANNSSTTVMDDVLASEAAAGFAHAVSMLNTQSGGRGLFSGAATDRAALADADTILTELRTLTAGETTAAGVAAVVDAWFAPGGGFEATGYTGSTTPAAPLRVGEGVEVTLDVKADDPALREALKGLAMAALVDSGPLDGSDVQRMALSQMAGEVLVQNEQDLLSMRALVGATEAAIDQASARNASEETSLSITRNKMTAVDPYQTAVELQEVEVQLEMLYSMTARLSRLTLMDYLR